MKTEIVITPEWKLKLCVIGMLKHCIIDAETGKECSMLLMGKIDMECGKIDLLSV